MDGTLTPHQQYTRGPLDGSLYAVVSKPKRVNNKSNLESKVKSVTFNGQYSTIKGDNSNSMNENGHTRTNGRGASVDSGISSSNASILAKTHPYSTINNNNHFHEIMNNNNNNINNNNHHSPQTNGHHHHRPVSTIQALIHCEPDENRNGLLNGSSISTHQKGNSISDTSVNLSNGKKEDNVNGTMAGRTRVPLAEQSQLDELLDGMLKEVENFPDYRGPSTVYRNGATTTTPNVASTATIVRPSDTVDHISPILPSKSAQIASSHTTHSVSKPTPSSIVSISGSVGGGGTGGGTTDDELIAVFGDDVSGKLDSVPNTSLRPVSPSSSTITSNTNERVSSPVPLITDHFGKMEPLPLRFLTKPEPIVTEKNRPYHARPGSQPFSYGVTAGSPALQRRRIHSESTAYICESSPRDMSTVDSDLESNLNYGTLDRGAPLSWLQRQQLKLKSRLEGRDNRTKEMVIAELMGSIIKQNYDKNDSVQGPSDSDAGGGSPCVTVNSPSSVAAMAAARAYSPGHYSKPLHIQTNGHHQHHPTMLNYTGAKPPLANLMRQNSIPLSPSTGSIPTYTSTSTSILSPSTSGLRQSSSAKNIPTRGTIATGSTTTTQSSSSTPNSPPSSSEPSPRQLLMRHKSDLSTNYRERPFVAVKRAHEAARNRMFNTGATPEQVISGQTKVYGPSYPYIVHPTATTTVADAKSSPGPSSGVDQVDHSTTPSTPSTVRSVSAIPMDTVSKTTAARITQSPNQTTPIRAYPSAASIATTSHQYSIVKNVGQASPSSWSASAVTSSPSDSPGQVERPSTPGFPLTPSRSASSFVDNYASSPNRYSNASPGSYHLNHSGKEITSLDTNGSIDSSPVGGPLGRDSPSQSIYYGQSRRSSLASLSESEVISQHPSFIKDTSKYWYKPNISREEAIYLLKDKPPGTFVIRDSKSYPGSFGLVFKVSHIPTNTPGKQAGK